MMLCNRGRFLIPPSLAKKVRTPQILRKKAVYPPQGKNKHISSLDTKYVLHQLSCSRKYEEAFDS